MLIHDPLIVLNSMAATLRVPVSFKIGNWRAVSVKMAAAHKSLSDYSSRPVAVKLWRAQSPSC